MSDSSNYSNMSDLEDIEDIELVLQLNQGESSRGTRKAINRDHYIAEARKPDVNDVRRLYDAHNRIHGLPGMLGSIDCMHWEWINCLKAWHGQFGRDDKKYQIIMLEAVASYDLWIWHAFFRVAGANNDLTVLNHSPLFDDLLDDITLVV
ncbi:ALP1-like protein [Tanacetum coccineum]